MVWIILGHTLKWHFSKANLIIFQPCIESSTVNIQPDQLKGIIVDSDKMPEPVGGAEPQSDNKGVVEAITGSQLTKDKHIDANQQLVSGKTPCWNKLKDTWYFPASTRRPIQPAFLVKWSSNLEHLHRNTWTFLTRKTVSFAMDILWMFGCYVQWTCWFRLKCLVFWTFWNKT